MIWTKKLEVMFLNAYLYTTQPNECTNLFWLEVFADKEINFLLESCLNILVQS
ncbi:hypothetical protein KC669_03830 [Candidatus Dojkabacteria bacterium]|uniref:Uncharacterized protein n=1 Tax=Candidatus Dojkabacteria bacterium TaxID=2099670 RepID=A0A955LAH4_9BACT|nr:hypothetical protein [Candidatus Dojkabacteria bacterium]